MAELTFRSFCIAGLMLGLWVSPVSAQVNRKGNPNVRPIQAAISLTSSRPSRSPLLVPQVGPFSIATFAADSGIELPISQEIPSIPLAGPAIAAVGTLPPGAVLPPGGGAVLPPWVRAPAPPGFSFIEPPRMAVENPDWAKALKLHIAINIPSIDPQARNAVELPWQWLSTKQQELYAEGESIDADWAVVAPGVRDAVNKHVDGYWELKALVEQWDLDLKHYEVYCRRSVPADELERAQRECLKMQSDLNLRFEGFKKQEADSYSAFARFATQPTAAHYAKIEAYLVKSNHWHGKVIEYNEAASQLLSNARKPDIRFIDRLVKKYGLDRCQRRVLHDEITGQNLSDAEIEEIAEELSRTGRGRCPRPGGNEQ